MSLYYSGHPQERFFVGDCAIFALAMHALTGKTVMAMLEQAVEIGTVCLVHAFVELDNEAILDAAGLSSVGAVRDEFSHQGALWVQPIDHGELLALAYDAAIPALDEIIPIAAEVLREVERDCPDEYQLYGLGTTDAATWADRPGT